MPEVIAPQTFFSYHLISFNPGEVRYHPELVGNTCCTATTTTPRAPAVTLQKLSAFSVRILEFIRDCKAVSACEICEKMGKEHNYVKQYLYRLRKKGFIFRNDENWKWSIEDLNSDFFVELNKKLNLIYNGNTKVTEKEHNGNSDKVLPQVLPNNNIPEIKEKPKRKPRKLEQLNLVTLLDRINQEQIERGVVEVLASEVENKIVVYLAGWYDKTETEAQARAYKHYVKMDDMADELGCDLFDFKRAIADLDNRGWIYTLPPSKDKYGMWKIGFTEEFLERVKNR